MQEAKLEEATRSSAELSDHVDYVESTLAECVSLLTEARALGGKPVYAAADANGKATWHADANGAKADVDGKCKGDDPCTQSQAASASIAARQKGFTTGVVVGLIVVLIAACESRPPLRAPLPPARSRS